jgi:hypothetical protein
MQLRHRLIETTVPITATFKAVKLRPAAKRKTVKAEKSGESSPLKKIKLENETESRFFESSIKAEPSDAASQIKQEIKSEFFDAPAIAAKSKKERTIRKAPENWQSTFEKIREFRRNNVAVVDTMGCERLADGEEGDKVLFS